SEEEIARKVMEIAEEFLGLNYGGFWGVDEARRVLVKLADVPKEENPRLPELSLDSEKGIIAAAARTGEAIYVPDTRKEPRYIRFHPGLLSEFAVPIKVGGRVVGVLNSEKEEVDGFTPDERESLVALASQAAIALETIRLRKGLQEQLEELTREASRRSMVQEIASLAASSLDVREILNLAAAKMVEVFQVDHCGIVLFDIERMEGEVAAEYPPQGVLGTKIELEGYPAAHYLIETGKPLPIADVETEPLLEPVRGLMATLGIKSILLVPMVAQETILGSIGLDVMEKKREFTTDEVDLAFTIAHQISIALQNAYLYEDIQRRYYQMAALQDATKVLNSELDLEGVLNLLTNICIGLLNADRSAICLFDETGEQLKCIANEGLSPLYVATLERCILWPSDIKEKPPPLIASDVLKEPLLAHIRGATIDEGISSAMLLPLFHRGRLEGMLGVFYDEPHKFAPGQVSLAQTLADQAAVAIGNALLFQEVRKAGEEWATTFNAIQDGIVILDQNHRIVRANEAFARLMGVPLEELPGSRCYEIVHKSRRLPPLCPALNVKEIVEPSQIEIKDPSSGRILNIAHYPIKDSRGYVRGLVCVYKDVTEEKRLQEHLLQAEKLASLGRMAAGLAHELNNPLTTVLGYARMLQENAPQEFKKGLKEIEAQAWRAASIVRGVLDFAEQRPPYRYKVSINELLEEAISSQQHRLESNNIEIKRKLDPSLP
ncbi:MAG TPA: GAF domain-containing protein, partial [Chloroflexi bacterium]|nr:GAF domain-containing protein [Chloroflexota bacterium]